MNIRLYTEKDYDLIKSWWGNHPASPPKDFYPEDTTYVLEIDNKPVATICLFLTNCRYAAWVENLVADPSIAKSLRKEAVDKLFEHVENEAKSRGYKHLVLFSYIDKLKNRYKELGYMKTLDNVTTFSKSLGGY